MKNRSKGRSGSEKCDFFCENAEVQQTPRGAGPNGSPHDPKSTNIGRGGSKIEKNLRKCPEKTRLKKSAKKNAKKGELPQRDAEVGVSGAARQGGGDLKIPKGNCIDFCI